MTGQPLDLDANAERIRSLLRWQGSGEHTPEDYAATEEALDALLYEVDRLTVELEVLHAEHREEQADAEYAVARYVKAESAAQKLREALEEVAGLVGPIPLPNAPLERIDACVRAALTAHYRLPRLPGVARPECYRVPETTT